ncbi:signal peptide peptidase SppA [Beijerinckia indica]|uniref:Signal peptide peptidase SppA, 36K type n=1 Tax=Beijerinckia indica subsp. indica (strain ATCC 9039 / DSM 1715 / NCIMB 8712) TaxID=395963 RepID=B2IKV7_BEII9|nr:signal peptide peptidase SppA [Beijerinckia indica]ACB96497.1 signal peptide peptidase SppA, 36K type [Beijerinckia indica subsp. indica ATCC 9039]
MPLSSFSDYMVERRLLRRKLSFWRIATMALVLAGIASLAYVSLGFRSGQQRAHIARLSISGLITGDRDTLRLIKRVEDSSAQAVLVSIESPGGTTTGAERIYEALRRLSRKKPTAAVVGTMAASGGYIAALGTDQIVAQGNSLVGSIGVLFQYPNVARLLDTLGVKVEEVKSSPLKASPNGFEPTTPEARAALVSLINDSYSWFKGLVKERRGMDDAQLANVSDGRVFTGRQGIPLHLVDRLGGEQEAIAWLEQQKGVGKNLPVRDWKHERGLGRWGIISLAAGLAEKLGLASLALVLNGESPFAGSPLLDGLVSIWQVDAGSN